MSFCFLALFHRAGPGHLGAPDGLVLTPLGLLRLLAAGFLAAPLLLCGTAECLFALIHLLLEFLSSLCSDALQALGLLAEAAFPQVAHRLLQVIHARFHVRGMLVDLALGVLKFLMMPPLGIAARFMLALVGIMLAFGVFVPVFALLFFDSIGEFPTCVFGPFNFGSLRTLKKGSPGALSSIVFTMRPLEQLYSVLGLDVVGRFAVSLRERWPCQHGEEGEGSGRLPHDFVG